MLVQVLFCVLAVVAIVAALGMLMAKSPVNSAFWLILNLFCVAGLYLTLNASFIATVQVLVYAGAIMVLFLFVIMLLNLSALPRLKDVDWKLTGAFVGGVAMISLVVYALLSATDLLPSVPDRAAAGEAGSASTLGKVLFTDYALMLEVIGILLLAATIGAVMLARKTSLEQSA